MKQETRESLAGLATLVFLVSFVVAFVVLLILYWEVLLAGAIAVLLLAVAASFLLSSPEIGSEQKHVDRTLVRGQVVEEKTTVTPRIWRDFALEKLLGLAVLCVAWLYLEGIGLPFPDPTPIAPILLLLIGATVMFGLGAIVMRSAGHTAALMRQHRKSIKPDVAREFIEEAMAEGPTVAARSQLLNWSLGPLSDYKAAWVSFGLLCIGVGLIAIACIPIVVL